MSNCDMLDLRMLADAWEEGEHEEEMANELGKLCVQLECEATPDGLREEGNMREFLLINEDYFMQYAKNFANDINAIDPAAGWPMKHIDWEAAVEELQQDYMSVEYDGQTFYVRL